MPINMSKNLISKMPEEERSSAEERLWKKSNGHCFLCDEPLNRASDDIQADHDIPESLRGETTIANLNLVHASCNKSKRDLGTIPIQPYLRLVAYKKNTPGDLKYNHYLPHFGITPKPVVFTVQDDQTVKFELPDHSIVVSPLQSETTATNTFLYTHVQLPANALFSDTHCQPRVVKLDHVKSIYIDLARNPLHEAPSCRAEDFTSGSATRLLLFDGQHKAIANWMHGRSHVTAKIYLNMTAAQANELVNSVQSRIKKLPLSPFELAAKMADEWESKFRQYETEKGPESATEAGFLQWLPSTERKRGKDAFQAALIQNILDSDDLRLKQHVGRARSEKREFEFTEQTLKSKVLDKLVTKEPLEQNVADCQMLRDREQTNIVMALNMLNDLVFEPDDSTRPMTPRELERARLISYQAALSYVTSLIRHLWNQVTASGGKKIMSQTLTDAQMEQFKLGMRRLADHPIWQTNLERDDTVRAVKLALDKNQDAEKAFEKVGLDLPYLVVGPQSTGYKAYWGSAE